MTGVVTAPALQRDLLFRLEAVLSFIERLDVIVTEPQRGSGPDMFEKFPDTVRTTRRYSGGGAIIGEDAFFRASRATFISLALDRLSDEAFCDSTGYRLLFFKATEAFRQRRPFIEVSFFLLFSGLEAYSRRSLGEPHTRPVESPISRQLQHLGFRAYQDSAREPERSMTIYAGLRNALFHDGALEARRVVGGDPKTYRLQDFIVPLELLVGLVVLRATGFDDGHINWDSWIDLQPFA